MSSTRKTKLTVLEQSISDLITKVNRLPLDSLVQKDWNTLLAVKQALEEKNRYDALLKLSEDKVASNRAELKAKAEQKEASFGDKQALSRFDASYAEAISAKEKREAVIEAAAEVRLKLKDLKKFLSIPAVLDELLAMQTRFADLIREASVGGAENASADMLSPFTVELLSYFDKEMLSLFLSRLTVLQSVVDNSPTRFGNISYAITAFMSGVTDALNSLAEISNSEEKKEARQPSALDEKSKAILRSLNQQEVDDKFEYKTSFTNEQVRQPTAADIAKLETVLNEKDIIQNNKERAKSIVAQLQAEAEKYLAYLEKDIINRAKEDLAIREVFIQPVSPKANVRKAPVTVDDFIECMEGNNFKPGLKNAVDANEHLKDAIDKYKVIKNEVQAALNNPRKTYWGRVKAVSNVIENKKELLGKGRDGWGMKFLKACASILTLGVAVAFGIWDVKGEKYATKVSETAGALFSKPKQKEMHPARVKGVVLKRLQ